MPLGINVAPGEWNAAMASRFKDMPADRFFGLMDDFMCWTRQEEGKSRAETENSHLDLLEQFLQTAQEGRVTLMLPKAHHAVDELEAVGMMYGHGKMWKTPWTTTQIQNYPMLSGPGGAKNMQRFLALVMYYGQLPKATTG